ncbi:hypothetical protein [Hominenteromicrobium sp.]|uniref:hypothetical protein n=1 Tax=Hominenteromicrobium sp. TaxID=3073581 RepID=UPI003A90D922
MLTPIDMKEWEKTCREKTGLGFETFKTIAHCDAETLDALLEAAFQTPLTEREQLLFRILSLKGLLGSLHNRAASIEMLEHK